MGYGNPKELLAAIEAKLPAGAPKLSAMIPVALPDFPTPLPDLLAIPTLPAGPTGLKREAKPTPVVVENKPPMAAGGETGQFFGQYSTEGAFVQAPASSDLDTRGRGVYPTLEAHPVISRRGM